MHLGCHCRCLCWRSCNVGRSIAILEEVILQLAHLVVAVGGHEHAYESPARVLLTIHWPVLTEVNATSVPYA